MLIAKRIPYILLSVRLKRDFKSRAAAVLMVSAFLVLGSFTIWALTLPAHLEWTIYGDLPLPSPIPQQTNASEVRNRLTGAGYNVTDADVNGDIGLLVTRASDDRFRAYVLGLGQAGPGLIAADGKYVVQYLRGDSWSLQEAGLRGKVARLVADVGLPVDASAMHVGDYDFASNNEFFLSLLHGFLVAAAAGATVLGALVRGSGLGTRWTRGSKD